LLLITRWRVSPALQVQLDLRKKARARLVNDRAVGAELGLCGPVFRVALQRKFVGVQQALAAGESRQEGGECPCQHSGELPKLYL
jgi:hypothetical protein